MPRFDTATPAQQVDDAEAAQPPPTRRLATLVPPAHTDAALRSHWLSVLAHAPREALAPLVERCLADRSFETLRAPEVGLVMLRARIGGEGDRFNLGEASVARCALRLRTGEGHHAIGLGYRLGRDLEAVRWMAGFDALLQLRTHQADLLRGVIEPLAAAREQARSAQARRAADSRVRFFELQPGSPP